MMSVISRWTVWSLAGLLLAAGAGGASSKPAGKPGGFPLRVTRVGFNVPCGVSHNPTAAVEVRITLENKTKKPVSLERAQWRVRRTRALLGDPSSTYDSLWTDLEEIGNGSLTEGLVKKSRPWAAPAVPIRTGAELKGPPEPAARAELQPGETADVRVRFIPGKYGHFSVLLKTDWKTKGPGFRAAGVAVVRPPAEGPRPRSPYLGGIPSRTWREGDTTPLDLAARLGVKWVRGSLQPREAPGREDEYDWSRADTIAGALRRGGILLQGELMGYRPLPHPRIGRALVTYGGGRKTNFVVRPEDFDRYVDLVYQTVKRYGDVMPAATIRNEPWEGGSVSNYHATAAYFRHILKISREAARRAKPDFLIVANDQIANFEDQIAMAGSEDLVDVTSHHTSWTDNRGAVQSAAMGKPAWENEDWASHYDAFVIANLTMKLAQGYEKSNPVSNRAIFFDHGRKTRTVSPAPQAQAISTWLHFIEDTEFDSEIHPECLPWMALFSPYGRGREGLEDKHVAVVIGRIKLYGDGFRKPAGDAAWPQITGFGRLRLEDPEWALRVYDISGNRVPRAEDDSYDIPLTEDAYYVTSKDGPPDLAKKLSAARARYDGNVFQTSLYDFTRPLAERPPVRVTVRNGILALVNAKVTLTAPEGWELETNEQELASMKPGEARGVIFRVRRAKESPANRYRFRVTVASESGRWEHEEELHVAVFARGTVAVDGDLSDWEEAGAVPVMLWRRPPMSTPGAALKHWFPFLDLKPADERDVFCRFAGLWDEEYFYVSAEVHDVKTEYRPSMQKGTYYLTHGKPLDYLYWWGPRSPGSRGDGLKMAFDCFRPGQKRDCWIPPEFQKRIDTRLAGLSADYEYDLYLGAQNRLSEPYEKVKARHLQRLAKPRSKRYKGDYPPFEGPSFETAGPPVPEVWRLMAPGVPRHNYNAFSPRKDRDQGLVNGAKLVVRRHGSFWRYEAAIPWEELAEVRPKEGREVRFSFYVLNDGRRTLSWTRNRSACSGKQILHPTWRESEAIETVWGFTGLRRDEAASAAQAGARGQ